MRSIAGSMTLAGRISNSMTTIYALLSDAPAAAACKRLTPDSQVNCEYLQSFQALEERWTGGVILVGEDAIHKSPASNGLPKEAGRRIPLVILMEDPERGEAPGPADGLLVQILGGGAGKRSLLRAIRHLEDLVKAGECSAWLGDALEAKSSELEIFNKIGMALGSERDSQRLLELILTYARQLTNADSGSIYIIRERTAPDEGKHKVLYFANTQSDTLDINFQGADMDVTERSIAGYVALHGEVLNLADADRLPSDSPYQYNRDFDRSAGYSTRSMLTLPMRNNENGIIGVLQLINKKKVPGKRLHPIERVLTDVVPFTMEDEHRALALSGQAAVALENSILYEEIERLFEGFIRALGQVH